MMLLETSMCIELINHESTMVLQLYQSSYRGESTSGIEILTFTKPIFFLAVKASTIALDQEW